MIKFVTAVLAAICIHNHVVAVSGSSFVPASGSVAAGFAAPYADFVEQRPLYRCENQFWKLHLGSGSCYQVSRMARNLSSAAEFCGNLGGAHLVTITSESEQAFVHQLIQQIQPQISGSALLIGLVNNLQTGEQQWQSPLHRHTNYSNFRVKFDTETEAEAAPGNCTTLSIENGNWLLANCSQPVPFICEKLARKLPFRFAKPSFPPPMFGAQFSAPNFGFGPALMPQPIPMAPYGVFNGLSASPTAFVYTVDGMEIPQFETEIQLQLAPADTGNERLTVIEQGDGN